MNIHNRVLLYRIHNGSKVSIYIDKMIHNYIVVDHIDVDKNKLLLDKIVSSIGLEWDLNIKLISLKTDEGIVMDINNIKHSQTQFLIFGISAEQLNIQYYPIVHHPLNFNRSIIHCSYSLNELKENINYKKALWNYFKTVSWNN